MTNKQEMTLAEFLATPDTYPMQEGCAVVGPCARALPPWVTLTDIDNG